MNNGIKMSIYSQWNRGCCLGIISAMALFASMDSSRGAISFILSVDQIRDAAGDVVDNGEGVIVLVADTNQDGFGAVQPGSADVGDFLDGADDLIVFQGDLWFVDGLVSQNPAGLDLGSGWTPNDPLALYWFPSNGPSAGGVVLAANDAYGFYTDSTGIDGSQPWLTPADGTTNYTLRLFTTDKGAFLSADAGSVDPSTVGASFNVIPEPSIVTLFGISACGMILFRRRRR